MRYRLELIPLAQSVPGGTLSTSTASSSTACRSVYVILPRDVRVGGVRARVFALLLLLLFRQVAPKPLQRSDLLKRRPCPGNASWMGKVGEHGHRSSRLFGSLKRLLR